MIGLFAAFWLCAAAVAAPVVSRDGHFKADLPASYGWVLDQYPAATHGHIVAAWSVPGLGFGRLEIALQSLRYMTPEQLKAPAAAACERWTSLDEITEPCRTARTAGGLDVSYTLRGARTGTDALVGFFDLGDGLVYCLMTQVASGSARPKAIADLIGALGSLAKADDFRRPPEPSCRKGQTPFYDNWPKAGEWKCHPLEPGEPLLLAPTDEPFNQVRRVQACPAGLTRARVDEPRPGDLGCVNFVQTNQRLLERFNHTLVFKCDPKHEWPVLYKRDGRKRDFVCDKLPKPKPGEDEAGDGQP